MTATPSVADGKVVSIHYTLTLDDGQVVDSSQERGPLQYLHGAGNIVPGLETALTGRNVGANVEVRVEPEEGYGMRDEEAVQTVERAAFPKEAKLEVGITFQAMDQDHNPLMGTITKIDGDQVTVDFNHPLAGMSLNFRVEVTAVRDATREERDHGHPHGPGGHHH
jgi:FKBP-type peptidyl-prolyl cis-trans isomerase SlyD